MFINYSIKVLPHLYQENPFVQNQHHLRIIEVMNAFILSMSVPVLYVQTISLIIWPKQLSSPYGLSDP